MPAGKQNITVERGATFETVVTWRDSNGNPVNITSYTARMQCRRSVEADDTLFSLTDAAGLTLGGTAGTITVSLTAAETTAIEAASGVYDLELVSPGGVVTRLLEGAVTFSPEVTR